MAASWARPDSWTTRQWWSPNAPAPITATLGCDIGGLPREFLQRRDAENAETSAEKSKHIDGRSPESRAVGRSLGVLGPLCSFLCVLCVSALKSSPCLVPSLPGQVRNPDACTTHPGLRSRCRR